MSEPIPEWKAAELALQQTIRPAVTLIAFGGGGVLIGSLIAGLSDGGLTPGLVIVCLAAPAFVGGLAWGRRLARLHRFRLVYRSSLPLLVLMLVASVVAVAVSLAIGAILGIAGGIFIAALLPLIVRFYVGARTAVLLSYAGIQIAHQRLPWPAVQHVRMADPGSPADVTIGVRLRDGAQLPDHLQLTDPTPARTETPHLSVAVPRHRVNQHALAAAVARFAPSGAPLVTTGVDGGGLMTAPGDPGTESWRARRSPRDAASGTGEAAGQ